MPTSGGQLCAAHTLEREMRASLGNPPVFWPRKEDQFRDFEDGYCQALFLECLGVIVEATAPHSWEL